MPTGEDILRHQETCPDCMELRKRGLGSCAKSRDILKRHLDEVDEGINRLRLENTLTTKLK